jgi:hypothetical protein
MMSLGSRPCQAVSSEITSEITSGQLLSAEKDSEPGTATHMQTSLAFQ